MKFICTCIFCFACAACMLGCGGSDAADSDDCQDNAHAQGFVGPVFCTTENAGDTKHE